MFKKLQVKDVIITFVQQKKAPELYSDAFYSHIIVFRF
ncbi:hypothetical protein LRI_1919 (plasmid) [Limosilactobacillus reuteri I5007]|uniref:Uncharacterized protein n=1 Tax=Limosilactobacillus reuteri I5007 TaxID=1340495 RepID=R9WK81_LIMRT|nr:hypothetical protein LRI_1919 [Limosilactobacillus reuteri I5007]